MNNKKAISAVVATVLIILITVAAAAMIALIVPWLKGTLDEATECQAAINSLNVVNGEYTCVGGGFVNVNVEYGSTDIGLVDIQFLVSSGGTTESLLLSGGSVTGNIPANNGKTTFVVTTSANETVQVAPVITVGSGNKTCAVSPPVTLLAC